MQFLASAILNSLGSSTPLLAQADPVMIGRIIGYSFILALILWGIVKCLAIMRRPETSAACVWALMLFLVSWLISSVTTIFRTHGNLPQIGLILSLTVTAIVVLGGLVVGIVGLVLYGKKEDPPYVQGRAQGIWGIILCVLVMLGMIGGFVTGMVKRNQQFQSPKIDWDVAGAPPKLLDSPEKVGEKKDDDLNFRFELPGSPWASMNPSFVNPIASLCLSSTRMQQVFMLIAERGGVDIDLSTEGLLEVARANLASAVQDIEFGETHVETVNGIEFSVLPSTARGVVKPGDVFHYEHWVTSKNGFYYQLVTYSISPKRGPDEVSRTAKEMAKRFSQLDPELVVYSVGGKPSQPVSHPSLGFDVDLSKSGWNQWLTADVDFPAAHFSAIKGADKVVGVVALDLKENRPDLDVLTAGYIAAMFGFEFPAQFSAPKAIDQGPASGYALSFSTRDLGSELNYQFRVLQAGSRAWLLAGWTDGNLEVNKGELSAALDEIVLYEPTPGEEEVVWPQAVITGGAEIMNQTGLSYYRLNAWATAIPYFRAAVEQDDAQAVFLGNLMDACMRSGKIEEGLEVAEEAARKHPENADLKAYHAYLLIEADRGEEATEVFEAAFSLGHENGDDLYGYINLLVNLERQEEGLEVLKKYRQTAKNEISGSAAELDRWEAQLLTQLGRQEEAVEILRKTLDEFPTHLAVKMSLAETLAEGGQYSEALELTDSVIDSGYEGADIFVLKGRCELGLDWFPKAKASFEKAQSLEPGNADIESFLTYVSSSLGKGDNSDIRKPIEPIKEPDAVSVLETLLIAEHGEGLSREFGHQFLSRVQGFEFRKGKPLKTTTRTSVRLLTPSGVDLFSTLRFPFDPQHEEFFVNEVVVKDKEGAVVSRANLGDFYVLDRSGEGMATTEKIVHVPVPGLEADHVLEYTVTLQYHAPNDQIEFHSLPLVRSAPSTGVIVYVSGEVDQVRVASHGEVAVERNENLILCHSTKPPVYLPESMQTWTESFLPWVWLNGEEESWQTLGENYLESIEDRITGDDSEIEAVVTRITNGLNSDAEKISALADHVQNILSYQAIEFGERARIPNAAGVTLKNRYGDCKDHSVLLYRFLKAAGIDASLALASTNSSVREEMPSLDQFNHMIVHVPGMGGAQFIDTTAKHFPAGQLPSESVVTETALVLEPGAIRFVEEKTPTANDHRIECDRHVAIEEDGRTLKVSETVKFSGFSGAWMRRLFKGENSAERKNSLARMLEHYGRPTITELKIRGLEKHFEPLVVEWTYRLRRQVRQLDNGHLRVRWPAIWESYFIRKHSPGERKNPFEILYPLEITSALEFTSPSDWVFQVGKESVQDHDESPFAKWDTELKSDENGGLKLDFSFVSTGGIFSAAEHEDYVSEMDAALAIWDTEARLLPNPDQAPAKEK